MSVRSTPSSVVIVSPSTARRMRKPPPPERVQVVRVVRLVRARASRSSTTSTTLLIGRIPARLRRSAIQAAEGPTRRPERTTATKRPQRSARRSPPAPSAPARRPPAPASAVEPARRGERPTSRATPRWPQAVGSVAGDVEVEHDVGSGAERLPVRHAERRVGRQDQDAGVVVAEAELARRAQHPLVNRCRGSGDGRCAPVGHRRAERGQRHDVAGLHVERAAPHVERLPSPASTHTRVDRSACGWRSGRRPWR